MKTLGQEAYEAGDLADELGQWKTETDVCKLTYQRMADAVRKAVLRREHCQLQAKIEILLDALRWAVHTRKVGWIQDDALKSCAPSVKGFELKKLSVDIPKYVECRGINSQKQKKGG